jgi:F420-non-reducing hydrogenase iron-sulfur subunit
MTGEVMTDTWSPKIIGFCCHYCAYTAADLAGSMRLQYPPNVRIIKVPCAGRVDIIHLLKTFEAGVDAVFVAGCIEGECHFLIGNLRAKKRVNKLKKDFAQMGFEPERLEMFNLSASEGPKFAAIVTEMVERTLKLGPSPLRQQERAAWLASQPQAASA